VGSASVTSQSMSRGKDLTRFFLRQRYHTHNRIAVSCPGTPASPTHLLIPPVVRPSSQGPRLSGGRGHEGERGAIFAAGSKSWPKPSPPPAARIIGWGGCGMLTWLKRSIARAHVWVHRPGLSDISYQVYSCILLHFYTFTLLYFNI